MKITVITVAYNSAITIADTLRSVAGQTHPDVEHWVIDGKSKDNTLQVVQAHRHPGLRVSSEPDRGIYDAMNKGLELASGEIVGFLNSDDFFADSQTLERVSKVFEDPSVDACYGDLEYVSEDTERVIRYWRSKPFLPGDFAKGWSPAHPTFYIRRSLLKRLGLFDLSYRLGADVEFMMRYLERGHVKARYIPHVLVKMRMGGASNQSWRNIAQQNREVFAGLRKNSLPFSPSRFWTHKLLARAKQYLAARLHTS